MIQEIKNQITLFNSRVGKYKEISFEPAATPDEMTRLQHEFQIPIPSDLASFYTNLGGLTPYSREMFAITIDTPEYICWKASQMKINGTDAIQWDSLIISNFAGLMIVMNWKKANT